MLEPLLKAWSIELSPTTLLKAGSPTARLLPSLPAGTRVYLPSLPNDPPEAIAQSISLLRRENADLVPVPHIPAQRVGSADELERRILSWQHAAAYDGALREALIVRGDAHGHDTSAAAAAAAAPSSSAAASASSSAPPLFPESLALLESGVLQRCGLDAVSLCGHPEGVGALSAAEARAALIRKLEWAESANVAARVVTQFCFDATTTAAFVDGLRHAGVGSAAAVPISLGVVGPARHDLRTRMAVRCGVASPPSAADEEEEDNAAVWPGEYMDALSRWHASSSSISSPSAADDHSVGVHVYPFGGLRRTLEWLGVS